MQNEHLPTIAEALEFRIEQYGHSRKEAAKIIGIQQSKLSEYLSGKRRVPLAVLWKLHKYGLPANVLMQVQKVHQ